MNLLFLGTFEDQTYAPHLKPLVGGATVFTAFKEVSTLTELEVFCKKRNISGVFSTSKSLLLKLLNLQGKVKPSVSIDNYQGSLFKYHDLEILFISPLKQLMTVDYGKFIAKRFISKLTTPSVWRKTPQFRWEVASPTNVEVIYEKFKSAVLIAVDIETFKENLAIRCIGYTAAFISGSGELSTYTVVLPMDSTFWLAWMRKYNSLSAPKVLQNGKYDCSYLARYNAPLHNYLWDTVNMFHCWYAELPKDLGYIAAFLIRDVIYWKDLSDTSDLHEYYRYNGLDTHGTLLAAIAWILEAPDWAKRNYTHEFPLVFPCHLSEMTGIKRDMVRLEQVAADGNEFIEKRVEGLSRMVGTWPQKFNTNSAPQNAALRTILGCKDIDSSDEKSLKKIASRHPINSRIANEIIAVREARKLVSTYLKVGDEGSEHNGYILYSINPHGTETGRMASRQHHFWCGLQIQNITGGESVKQTLVAPEGFRIAECDLKQAETRDTAYIAGETNLIKAVTGVKDFHAVNASAFFGVPYESIYDDSRGKTLDKVLRNLAKRVNHGANYLMGWSVLIDTMGEASVWEAKRLLKLPKSFGLRDVAEYLLAQFHKTYPILSQSYYPAVVHEVMTTQKLVSHTHIHRPSTYGIEPKYENGEIKVLEGWTRWCFGNPRQNKLDKNSYVAHVSQSLNSQALNVAYLRVFYEIALNPKYSPHFKLLAQIHDSILFYFREGHEYLCDMVRERMEVPITIRSYDGIIRTFTVPADIKAGSDGKGAHRWSETE